VDNDEPAASNSQRQYKSRGHDWLQHIAEF
jgi:hypothetical protein